MTTPIIPGANSGQPVPIPPHPPAQIPAPLAPPAPQIHTVPQATDPRGEKRGRDEEGGDAIEASGQPQFKRARLDSAPQDPRVPMLFDAIARGDLAGVTALLTQSPGLRGVYAPGPEGRTLLCDAAVRGQQAIVGLLLSLGEPVDRPSRNRKTPLMFAAQFGQVAIMHSLCLLGANPDIQISFGSGKVRSPISCAINDSQLEACKCLLSMGVDLHKIRSAETNEIGRNPKYTPLIFALQGDFSDLIAWLLEAGRLTTEWIDPLTKLSLINAAAYFGAADSVHLLLQRGADPIKKQVFPDGKTYDGVLAVAQEMKHFHVLENALRYRETAFACKSNWPLPVFKTQIAIDLSLHADLWLSPAGKDADGLKDAETRRCPHETLMAVARLCSTNAQPSAFRKPHEEFGWSSFFSTPTLPGNLSHAIATILGKNAFMRPESEGRHVASQAQELQMLIERISLICGTHAPFSGYALGLQTEQLMNRMFDLQRDLMLDAIKTIRTTFEKNVRRLPGLCMDRYISRSGKLNEPDLYRNVTKEVGLYDPVARAVLRLVKDAYKHWHDLKPEQMSDEFKALSPAEQLQRVMVPLLEDSAEPEEFETAIPEGIKPEVAQRVAELLKQQWRLFGEAFGVSWSQSSKFGPHKPAVVPADLGMEVDVKSVDEHAVGAVKETVEEVVEEVVEDDLAST
jgi:hypothetical protein